MVLLLTTHRSHGLFVSLLSYVLVCYRRHPIATAVCGVLYHLGSILYLMGYSDTALEVKTARYKKGGTIKFLGFFGVVGMAIKVAGLFNKWW